MTRIFPILLVAVSVLFWAFSISRKDTKPATSDGKTGGIQFIESDWNRALEEAKKQHKLIFLDAYAAWCGPCKLLKKKTFPDKAAGDFFNENFISVAVDMEKGIGPSLAEQFRVDAYPTLIIADDHGNAVAYTKGYMSATDLIEFGKYGLHKAKK